MQVGAWAGLKNEVLAALKQKTGSIELGSVIEISWLKIDRANARYNTTDSTLRATVTARSTLVVFSKGNPIYEDYEGMVYLPAIRRLDALPLGDHAANVAGVLKGKLLVESIPNLKKTLFILQVTGAGLQVAVNHWAKNAELESDPIVADFRDLGGECLNALQPF